MGLHGRSVGTSERTEDRVSKGTTALKLNGTNACSAMDIVLQLTTE